MVKPKYRINIFDVLCIVAILSIAVVVALARNNQPYLGSRTVVAVIQVNDEGTVDNIASKLQQASQVYIGSNHYFASQLSADVTTNASTGKKQAIIKISGLGDISNNKSIFLGQRIYANQEVQIHSNYFAKGYVTDFYYEN